MCEYVELKHGCEKVRCGKVTTVWTLRSVCPGFNSGLFKAQNRSFCAAKNGILQPIQVVEASTRYYCYDCIKARNEQRSTRSAYEASTIPHTASSGVDVSTAERSSPGLDPGRVSVATSSAAEMRPSYVTVASDSTSMPPPNSFYDGHGPRVRTISHDSAEKSDMDVHHQRSLQSNVSGYAGSAGRQTSPQHGAADTSDYKSTTGRRKRSDLMNPVSQAMGQVNLASTALSGRLVLGGFSATESVSTGGMTRASSEPAFSISSQQDAPVGFMERMNQLSQPLDEETRDYLAKQPEPYWDHRGWNYISRNANGSWTWKVRPRTPEDGMVPPTRLNPACGTAGYAGSDTDTSATASNLYNLAPPPRQRLSRPAQGLESNDKRPRSVYIEDDDVSEERGVHQPASRRQKR